MVNGLIFLAVAIVAIWFFYRNMYMSAQVERVNRELKCAKKDIEFYKKLAEMWEEKYNDDQPIIIKNL